ncbi:hypothetical protein BsWGS_21908 [Bradybaena similaris]
MKHLKEREHSDFGASVAERNVITPLISFMLKMSLKKRRQVKTVTLKKDSKWRLLRTPVISHKLHLMYLNLRKDQCEAKFRRLIHLVICSMRFIISIRIIARSTQQILKELERFQERTRTTCSDNSLTERKRVFDPSKYTFKEMFIPFETMLTLTKPWFVRTDKEIDKVVAVLQSYKSFVEYPPVFQRRLAAVAWYIETDANKYIIRQRHIACNFYVILRGKAMEVRLFGDPYIEAYGEMRVTRYLRKTQGFGDESMSDPESLRDYSIISCEPCALLAISVYDYNVMLHTRKDYESAPEHIIFISHLGLMEDFPKKKLLEEGDENITIHYFRQETVIAQSLKTSNYVFVVINGNCRIISEMPPERPMSKSRALKLKSPKIDSKARRLSSFHIERDKVQEEVEQRVKDDLLRLQYRARKGRKDSSAATAQQLLTDEIADLERKSHEILKTLPREVRKTLNMRNFEKMVAMSQQAIHSEDSGQGALPLNVQESVHNLRSNLSLSKWTNMLAELVAPQKASEDIPEEESTVNDNIESPPSEHRSLSPKFISSMSLSSLFSEDKAGDKTPFASNRESLQPEDEPQEQVTEKKRTELTPLKEPQVKTTKLPPMRGSVRFDQKSKASDAAKYRKRFSVRPRGGDPKVLDQKYCSRWKHIRYMSRGDYAGQEWLDFNTGPYDPPKETWSLVSDGCEVVMIKKSFLLKHMHREW